jgi:hypothetical protein
MIDLTHLESEFEKVHDALPVLTVRVAVIEEWLKSHPETHRLEGVALAVAKVATDLRLESMNNLRLQIDSERGSFVARELYDREHTRVREEITNLRQQTADDKRFMVNMTWYEAKHKDMEDRISKLEQYMWRAIGFSVAAGFIFSSIAALVGWILRFHA